MGAIGGAEIIWRVRRPSCRNSKRMAQMTPDQQSIESIKHVGDAVSAILVLGALVAWLPPIAAIFTILWTGIRIFETRTVQRLLGREE